MAKGLSPLGQGLLSGIGGALGAVEDDFREQRTFDRERTLEDYRLEKQKELAKLKNQFDSNKELVTAEAKVTAVDLEHERQVEDRLVTEAGLLERSKISAAAAERASKPTGTETKIIHDQAVTQLDRSFLDAIVAQPDIPAELARQLSEDLEAGESIRTILELTDIDPDTKERMILTYEGLLRKFNDLRIKKVTDPAEYDRALISD